MNMFNIIFYLKLSVSTKQRLFTVLMIFDFKRQPSLNFRNQACLPELMWQLTNNYVTIGNASAEF